MFDYKACVDGTVGRCLTDGALEDELCAQAAHMAVAECHFVLLVAEMDRRGTWAAQGLTSMAHWLSWRCGSSPGAAREQVRVGRALEHLPVLRQAFASGELSYSKARAITRVATKDNEASLVEVARYTTASQLELVVREYRNASPEEGQDALARHQSRRSFRTWTDDDGMVILQSRLSPEDAVVVLGAIETARQAAWLARQGHGSIAGGGRVEGSGDVTGVPAGTPAGALLPQDDADDWELSRADALVQVCEAALSAGLDGNEGAGPAVNIVAHVDAEVLADPTKPGCCSLEGVGAISSHTARRLACSGTVHSMVYGDDATVVPGAAAMTRSVPRRLRRAVLARDRGCRFPGCSQRQFVDVHHVVFWSDGGPTVASNLASLCRHHHRLVHEGGFRLEMDSSCHVRAWAPDGSELLTAPPLLAAVGPWLDDQHHDGGLDIDEQTMSYGGEPMDLSFVLDVLVTAGA